MWNEDDFQHFCRLVRERSGLVLTPEKAYLVESRLGPVARAEGLGGVAALLNKLATGPSEVLAQRCVDAMATHESFFFRDGAPFEHLARDLLPKLIAARQESRTLRIWCAACSSGQEPYSVAMLLQEQSYQLTGWRLEVVATDMSEHILKKARSGLYSDFEARRGLTPERLSRWFTQRGPSWEVSPALSKMISFRPHNLLQGSCGLGRFDVIFCRNVLIYFDVDQKRKVLDALRACLADDGYLLLGSAETVLGITNAFEIAPGSRGVFRPTVRTGAARTG